MDLKASSSVCEITSWEDRKNKISSLLKSLFCPSYAKVTDLNSIPNRKKCPENCVIVNHNMDKREYYYNISNCKLIVLINCTISQEFVKYKEYDIYFINCKFACI